MRTLLEHGDLEMGHGRALLGLTQDLQSQAAARVVARGLSVRQTEALVRSMQKPVAEKPGEPDGAADVRQLEQKLAETLGAKVQIQSGKNGKGKLVVNYNSLDELDGILSHIS